MLSVSGYFGVIPKKYDDDNRIRPAEDVVTYLRVRPKQLVANTMWLNFRGLGVAEHEGIVSPAYRTYDLGSELHPPFVHHLLRSEPYVGEYTRLAYGIRPNSLQVSREDFAALPVAVPPLATQQAIARFLDRNTAAIDALIEKKQKLLDLLAEKRAALINQAVTKGLDPTVPMKDSGIPWIGEIPSHWSLMSMKRVCRSVRDGTHCPPPRFPAGEHRLLSARNIQEGEFILRDDDRRMTAEAFAGLERSYTVRPGDIVLACVGATTGKCAVVGAVEKISVQRSLAILRPRQTRVLPSYLRYWLDSRSNQHSIQLKVSQYAAQGGIYLEDVACLPIVVPPFAEQHRILAAVEPAEAQLLKAIDLLSRTTKKLREYRQALITAAVTGQINVTEGQD